jgi:hypothetical protein
MSYPDQKRSFPQGDPEGPSIEELKKKYIKKYRTGPSKFEGPYGFREEKYKRKWNQRYPRLGLALVTGSGLSLFFGPFIYDVFFKPVSLDAQYVTLLKKKRLQESGLWYSPFGVKKPVDE